MQEDLKEEMKGKSGKEGKKERKKDKTNLMREKAKTINLK